VTSKRATIADTSQEIDTLTARAQRVAEHLGDLARPLPAVQCLTTVPGVGVLTATALVAFVGDIRRFRSGRDFAAYLGLTPREYSTGSVRRLGRITKRGNRYLRMLLVHGARSALWAGKRSPAPDNLRTWALDLQRRKGHNVAAVALANKLARICWRVWKDERPFQDPRGRLRPRSVQNYNSELRERSCRWQTGLTGVGTCR